eukprot:3446299-Rhodomonas_salina.1
MTVDECGERTGEKIQLPFAECAECAESSQRGEGRAVRGIWIAVSYVTTTIKIGNGAFANEHCQIPSLSLRKG